MAKAKKHARKLDAGFAGQPAGEMAAALIRAQQKAFRGAWKHYQKAGDDDPDALHDLRVELRRLRAWLRLARDVVKTRKSARRRLKVLGRSTSPMRDREVMLELLKAVGQTPDCTEVAERIAYLTDEHEPPAHAPLVFDLKPALKPRARSGTPRFSDWFGGQLTLMTDLIRRDFAQGRDGFHAARIQVKHLRYLVEPMAEPFAEVAPLLKDLKEIQDRLGDLHDLLVLRQRLPTYAGWLVADDLPEALVRPGKQTRAVTRSFAGVRDAVICLAGWQHEAFESQWNDWEARRSQLAKRVVAACDRLAGSLDSAGRGGN
ncbi:CHAD domain-containing protein [Guyparkeria hydrothermalis]|uniref:CHAD domain-containing protein n=1 Tax=Guyparkeria hydrothermalis TaxID=923 RepID=UPI002020DC8A|nr:CHAD domain-containing protein [Guyparkeria hydrothermalis]MCL7745270.1 CHAD domain-containing protein [Guyparkeria hydrothermalis]